MTMHMLPAYYTTNNTRRRKKKKKTQSMIAAEREHEKFLKRMGVGSRSSVGVEQRSSKPWVTGSSPVESANSRSKKKLQIPKGACAKPEPKVYTGDVIIGIAQMHKSNAVPIARKQDAVDISRMRR
tara:strand:+ start:2413 stop:2790 length:378 start_codon:yes stop_codon:yes gene_type:complete